jgi:DNA polymerase-1
MDFLANKYLNYRCISFKEVVPKGSVFKDILLNEALPYAAEDSEITLRLFHHLKPLIKESRMDDLFHKLEMPLIDVLVDMEMNGISLNAKELEDYSVELEREIQLVEQKTFQLAGREFNMQSPKQLQQILFEDLNLPVQKKNKTGYSTDTSVLEILSQMNPVPELILRNRSLNKLKSTYVDKLPLDINKETGRIHSSFIQTGTTTGRLSCKDPNLQNIPVRDEMGRRIRKAFKAVPGNVLISADYSQIELVLLAHLSGDENLIEAFIQGEDIHSQTASILFHIPLSEVDSQKRRIAKSINFGVVYGMSAFRLSNELKIPRKEAADFIDRYFEQYSGVRAFIDATVASAETQGGVYTISQRYRPIPSINSRNKTEQKAAHRMAINTVIQGSAADIVKQAMLAINKHIKRDPQDVSLLIQVHDEFIFETTKARAASFIEELKPIMENIITLKCPLRVNCEFADNWGEMH